jgi:hypothetical protein
MHHDLSLQYFIYIEEKYILVICSKTIKAVFLKKFKSVLFLDFTIRFRRSSATTIEGMIYSIYEIDKENKVWDYDSDLG